MRKQWKQWDFILGGSKITADGDCIHEIKRHLLLGRKVMINLYSILNKQRHYFANKGPSSQSYRFSSSHVWIWEFDYKSWAGTFALWYWRRHLRVLWTAKRSNQSVLKEISPEYSLEGLMLKLNLQYFGHLMWTDSLEKTLMLGKIEVGEGGNDRGWTGLISLQSKGLSRVFSNTTVQKHQFFSAQLSLWSNSHIQRDYWKNHSFD